MRLVRYLSTAAVVIALALFGWLGDNAHLSTRLAAAGVLLAALAVKVAVIARSPRRASRGRGGNGESQEASSLPGRRS
jgi:hypothetical protein